MRKRNSNFTNSIGELVEEISNQDLEMVNGGDKPVVTNSNATKGPICVVLPCVTKDRQCMTKDLQCAVTVLPITKND